jgi:hypothetical protein
MANLLGGFGGFAPRADGVGSLSFRGASADTTADEWRDSAKEAVLKMLSQPHLPTAPLVTRTTGTSTHDGLLFEELDWENPVGPPTQATFVKPANMPAGKTRCVLWKREREKKEET